MVSPAIIYALLLLGLTAIAIYVQVTSSTLSLPLSTGTTALTIVLPLLAIANTLGLPRLMLLFQHRSRISPTLQQLLPIVLQAIQSVLAVVLATLMAEGFAPGHMLDCGLEGSWQWLWHTRDGRAIERIQDTLSCCGLHSLVDRAWPDAQCHTLYKNRHDSCLSPWRSSMQRSAGLGFGVAVAIGILQLIQLVPLILGISRVNHTRAGYVEDVTYSDASEGLLENGSVHDSETDPQPNNGSAGGARGYGSTENRPIVQPSNLGDNSEENTWRS